MVGSCHTHISAMKQFLWFQRSYSTHAQNTAQHTHTSTNPTTDRNTLSPPPPPPTDRPTPSTHTTNRQTNSKDTPHRHPLTQSSAEGRYNTDHSEGPGEGLHGNGFLAWCFGRQLRHCLCHQHLRATCGQRHTVHVTQQYVLYAALNCLILAASKNAYIYILAVCASDKLL